MGSFYNVLGLRVPDKQSIIKPRSHCPNCGHDLSWKDLFPVLSFLFLKGKCRYCHEKISLLYPLNEIFCGVLFAISFYSWYFSSKPMEPTEIIVAITLSV